MIRYLLALAFAASSFAAPVTVRWVNPTQWTDGSALTQAQIRFANLHCSDWVVSVPVTAPSAVFEVDARASCRLALVATKTDAAGYRESDMSAAFTLTPSALGGPGAITVEWSVPTICTTRCTAP